MIRHLSTILNKGLEIHPESLVISSSEVEYSFKEFNKITDAIACELLSCGMSHDDRLVILAEKSIITVALAIACWKIGAVYAPLDIDNPPERIRSIVRNLSPLMMFIPKGYDNPLKGIEDVPKLDLRPLSEYLDHDSGRPKQPQIFHPEDIAYILHTSGTTGEPKGACISHRAVASFFSSYSEYLEMSSSSASINIGPFHFDVTFQDTFMPIFVGGRTYIFEGMLIPPLLLTEIKKQEVSHLFIVAPILAMLTEYQPPNELELPNLEVLITGAEVCSNKIINKWRDSFKKIRIVNSYGPTETNSVSVVYDIKHSNREDEKFYPIGTPLKNVITLHVDECNRPISETEIVGELLIGGSQMMSGYWMNSGYDRNKIIIIDGEEYYQTGDLVYKNTNGFWCFVGRKDNEVKILGRRINLLEVENALSNLPNISASIANVLNLDNRKRLVAAVFKDIKYEIDPADIFNELDKYLPSYMVPESIAIYDGLVNNSRGKLDRKLVFYQLEKSIDKYKSRSYIFIDGELKPHLESLN